MLPAFGRKVVRQASCTSRPLISVTAAFRIQLRQCPIPLERIDPAASCFARGIVAHHFSAFPEAARRESAHFALDCRETCPGPVETQPSLPDFRGSVE